MLTTAFYQTLTAMLSGDRSLPGALFIAVGAGSAAWTPDDAEPDRAATGLHREVARLPVTGVALLDELGAETTESATRVRFSAIFDADEGLGELRECGLFGGDATDRPGSGILLSYIRHPTVSSGSDSTLERAVVVDLEPLPFVPGAVPTRWLGNASTKEVHDVEHLTGACHQDDIRIDHRFYLTDLGYAEQLGYDRCAFCFGREQSNR